MLKTKWLILLLLLLPRFGHAQALPDSNYFDLASIKDSVMAMKKAMLFFDSNNRYNFTTVLSQPFSPFRVFNSSKNIMVKLVAKTAYLKIGIYNSTGNTDTAFIFPGIFYDNIQTYKIQTGNIPVFENDGSKNGYVPVITEHGQKSEYLLKLNFSRYSSNSLKPRLIRSAYIKPFLQIYRTETQEERQVGNISSGMLLAILLLALSNFILDRKKEFLYYSGYAFFTLLLVFFSSYFYNKPGSASGLFFGYLDFVFLITGSVFYLAFIRHFLNTKTVHTPLDRVFKVSEIFMLLLLSLFTAVHYLTSWYVLEFFLETAMKVILLCIGVFFIVFAFKQRQRITFYLAIGNLLNILFATLSLVLLLISKPQHNGFLTPFFYYCVGSVCSLAFFLLGLTYKNRQEVIERTKEQEALKLDVEKKVLENQIAVIKAQQEERNRISADMHDDLGAGMTTIRLYSELAKAKLGGQQMPEIEKISSSANELLTKMNAIIWSMSSSNDSLGNMVAYIRSYSLEYFENTGIKCNISLPDDLPNIVVNGPIRRNVFLVVKETLNNILKHSGATQVNINLIRMPNGLKLTIHDNGKGIDFEKLRQFGNGLKNMKKRMDDTGIQFSIENSNGTLVTLFRVITDF
jgi:signal transduction histidine kinase